MSACYFQLPLIYILRDLNVLMHMFPTHTPYESHFWPTDRDRRCLLREWMCEDCVRAMICEIRSFVRRQFDLHISVLDHGGVVARREKIAGLFLLGRGRSVCRSVGSTCMIRSARKPATDLSLSLSLSFSLPLCKEEDFRDNTILRERESCAFLLSFSIRSHHTTPH